MRAAMEIQTSAITFYKPGELTGKALAITMAITTKSMIARPTLMKFPISRRLLSFKDLAG
jgi:hypothetical protein